MISVKINKKRRQNILVPRGVDQGHVIVSKASTWLGRVTISSGRVKSVAVWFTA